MPKIRISFFSPIAGLMVAVARLLCGELFPEYQPTMGISAGWRGRSAGPRNTDGVVVHESAHARGLYSEHTRGPKCPG